MNVDAKKWTYPPFSAERKDGYVYGRGTVDDKDNVTGALMTMLLLKRQNVALDRDVIFLAEAGEEGATRIGIQFMVNQHFAEIDAEFCYAEGGNVTRVERRRSSSRRCRPWRKSPARFGSPRKARPDTARCRSKTTPSRISATPSARWRRGRRRRG